MKKIIGIVILSGLSLNTVAGEVTDTFNSGDVLTATKMENIKSAVNDNDSRTATNETLINISTNSIGDHETRITQIETTGIHPVEPFIGSTLLNQSEQRMLNKWTGNVFQEWQLCYSSAANGFTVDSYKSLCQRSGPTVSVVKNQFNNVYGGYNPRSFYLGPAYVDVKGAFIYSITNSKKYYQVDTASVYAVNYLYGPAFGGGHDFVVGHQGTMATGYCNLPHSYYFNKLATSPSVQATQELCGSNPAQSFQVTAVEVYVQKN